MSATHLDTQSCVKNLSRRSEYNLTQDWTNSLFLILTLILFFLSAHAREPVGHLKMSYTITAALQPLGVGSYTSLQVVTT